MKAIATLTKDMFTGARPHEFTMTIAPNNVRRFAVSSLDDAQSIASRLGVSLQWTMIKQEYATTFRM